MRLGAALFANHCAMCHGSDARGAPGFPNLRDGHWQWGGTPEAILHSILRGREGVMPGFAAALGSETAVSEVAVYVQSLAGLRVDPELAAAGRQAVSRRSASHATAPTGRGNPLLGAPDLTAGAYTYGASFEALRETVAAGRHGIMPPQGPVLGELRARIVAAYVWAFSRQGQASAARAGGGGAR
ncbi:MAG: c-type cytochrome [Xanthomonadales bacterium]|nr:c-type cytochrome [Xanthomonadales bacterium]